MSRNYRVRRLVLQGLCCLDAQGKKALEGVYSFIEDSDEKPETVAAARVLLRDVYDNLSACDAMLSRHAKHWDLGRLAMVDRNIIRLAVHEVISKATPFKVAITEAMKLAREFSTAQSPRFVNGVLDAVAREFRGALPPAGAVEIEPPPAADEDLPAVEEE